MQLKDSLSVPRMVRSRLLDINTPHEVTLNDRRLMPRSGERWLPRHCPCLHHPRTNQVVEGRWVPSAQLCSGACRLPLTNPLLLKDPWDSLANKFRNPKLDPPQASEARRGTASPLLTSAPQWLRQARWRCRCFPEGTYNTVPMGLFRISVARSCVSMV